MKEGEQIDPPPSSPEKNYLQTAQPDYWLGLNQLQGQQESRSHGSNVFQILH